MTRNPFGWDLPLGVSAKVKFYLKYGWLVVASFGFTLMPDATIPFGSGIVDFSGLGGLFMGIFLGIAFKELNNHKG